VISTCFVLRRSQVASTVVDDERRGRGPHGVIIGAEIEPDVGLPAHRRNGDEPEPAIDHVVDTLLETKGVDVERERGIDIVTKTPVE